MVEQTQTDESNVLRMKRRKSCLVAIFATWFVILGVILVVMFVVRKRLVSREPAEIKAAAAEYVNWKMPEHFEPYSMTHLLDRMVLAYWDQAHVREDGRSLAMIALFIDSGWTGTDLKKLETDFLVDARERFGETDFKVVEQKAIDQGEGKARIMVFKGKQKIDDKLEDASSCYLFLQGSKGPFQVYTLGIDEAFPLDDQIAFLKSVVEK